jgi:hypothetical protein
VTIKRRNAGPLFEGARSFGVAALTALGSGSAVALHDLPTRTAAVRTNRLRHLYY